MSALPFAYLLLLEPLGLLYGSSGRTLSPETLTGRAAEQFPPDAPTIAGLIASQLERPSGLNTQDTPLWNLHTAGPFWINLDGDLMLPAPLTLLQEHSGIVVDRLSQRKAELVEMKPVGGQNRIRLVFTIPSRGLIGYQSEFRNATRGTGVLTRLFKGYEKFKGVIDNRRNGSLISSATGTRCVCCAGCCVVAPP
jgi:hypothetical protein